MASKAKRAPSPSEAAYRRVREICLGFPAAEEKLSHGAPAFHVRGKMFLSFVDDHHGDGHLAVWCKSTPEEQRRLVAGNPARFYVPPYVGVKGWVGVNVDAKNADWIELSILVEEAWRSIAPPKVLRGEAPAPRKRLPPAPARVQTDEKVARAAYERLTALCTKHPGVEVDREGRHATYRVRKKVFAYFLDNHHGDGVVGACVRGDRRANAAAIEADPKRYFSPAYVGPRGYLGIRLDLARVDWKDVAARLAAAFRSVAPKSLL
ncbi:MAG: MmcQ/YjbR family DNA-binding protein [Polyangiaceae bacterium]